MRMEQLVEKTRRVQRVDPVHRPRLVQLLCHPRVISGRGLPSRQLRQSRSQILLAGRLPRHGANLPVARLCVQQILSASRPPRRTYSESQSESLLEQGILGFMVGALAGLNADRGPRWSCVAFLMGGEG